MKKITFLLILFVASLGYSQGLQMAECSSTGQATFDLTSYVLEYTGGVVPSEFTISYHTSQADANNNVNPIANPSTFQNTYNPQIIFVRAYNNVTNTVNYPIVNLIVNNPPVVSPLTFIECNPVQGNSIFNASVLINQIYTSLNISPNSHTIYLYESATSISPISSGIILVDLDTNGNGTKVIYYSVIDNTSGCSSLAELNLVVENCFAQGNPNTLTSCLINNEACFDLTENTLIMTGGNPNLSVTYFNNETDATSNVNPIANPSDYCVSGSNLVTICSRIFNTIDQTFIVQCFELQPTTFIDESGLVLEELYTCDDNGDGIAFVDLTSAESLMSSPVSVTYYSSPAISTATQINAPTMNGFSVNVLTNFVYAYATYANSCPILYRIEVTTYATCNNAYVCEQANSLCSALGEPFVNTFQGVLAEVGNSYGCLSTQPNPTWFYLPVSSSGNLQFLIEQNTSIDFNAQGLDVDFICYGPFTSPTTPCNSPLQAFNIVDCSYSASAVEDVSIPNATIGEYYLIMVTNFSGQPGFIRINEIGQGPNSGSLDCSGFNLLAFLDSNNNGIQDPGEPNFPLGVFDYDINTSGTINNITSPTGSHSIYEDDATASYDFGYSILPEYASYYSISTAAYTNQMISATGGMTTLLFPITSISTYTDVASYIVPLSPPVPGFTYTNRVFYGNLGPATVPAGTLAFNNGATVSILSISEPTAALTTTGFTFNYTNLLPFEYRFIDVEMTVPVLPVVNLGDLVTNTVSITPINSDINPINNVQTSTQIIIGSYDPNDKMESHGPEILHASFTENDYLFYTIRFQNSGTASAVNVRIEDFLNPMIDEESVRMIQSSHNYTLDRVDNQLVWYFNNIQLPHEGVSYELSQGYVYFKVKLKPGFEVGDVVPNGASIYFDFNPPIITNTFNTTFTANLSNPFANLEVIKVYPNPMKDVLNISLNSSSGLVKEVIITSVLGKQIKVIKIDNLKEFQIPVKDLATGIYLLEITTSNNKNYTQKIVKE